MQTSFFTPTEGITDKNKKERKEKDNPLIRKEGVNGPASYTLSSLSFGMVVLFLHFLHTSQFCVICTFIIMCLHCLCVQ